MNYSHRLFFMIAVIAGSETMQAAKAPFGAAYHKLQQHALPDIIQRQNLLDSQLLAAAKVGNDLEIKRLIRHGANPNTVVPMTSDSVLARAAKSNHPRAVQTLLEYGADPNRGFPDPLYYAAVNDDLTSMQALIAKEADTEPALWLAIHNSKAEAIQRLAAAGANIKHDALGHSPLNGAYSTSIAKLLIQLGAPIDAQAREELQRHYIFKNFNIPVQPKQSDYKDSKQYYLADKQYEEAKDLLIGKTLESYYLNKLYDDYEAHDDHRTLPKILFDQDMTDISTQVALPTALRMLKSEYIDNLKSTYLHQTRRDYGEGKDTTTFPKILLNPDQKNKDLVDKIFRSELPFIDRVRNKYLAQKLKDYQTGKDIQTLPKILSDYDKAEFEPRYIAMIRKQYQAEQERQAAAKAELPHESAK